MPKGIRFLALTIKKAAEFEAAIRSSGYRDLTEWEFRKVQESRVSGKTIRGTTFRTNIRLDETVTDAIERISANLKQAEAHEHPKREPLRGKQIIPTATPISAPLKVQRPEPPKAKKPGFLKRLRRRFLK